MFNFFKNFFIFLFLGYFISFNFVYAVGDFNAQTLLPKAEMYISPRSGSFTVGSTFDVPIYLNTKNNNINAVNLKLSFDPNKLSIISPSGGKSIFGIWVQPPSYDNKKGIASLIGLIPEGIVTSSGLISTVTFKAIATGEAKVSITNSSSANLNDGLGTEVDIDIGNAFYNINPKIPEGVTIYSDTHQLQDRWYNNNSPSFRWDGLDNVDGFSVLFDLNPNSLPNTEISQTNSFISFENLKDGIWYLHVRAKVKGVWGNTSHFQVKIDTIPPAKFNPDVNKIKDVSGLKKYFVSFLTTDSHSGIEHYEVGVMDKSIGNVASPIFIQTESPYLVQINESSKNIRVIIRAFDQAGNMGESSVDIYPGFTFWYLLNKYSIYLMAFVIILLILELISHFLFGHHIFGHIRRAYRYFRRIRDTEEKMEDKIEEKIEKMNPININNNLNDIPKPPVINDLNSQQDTQNHQENPYKIS